MKFYTNVFQKGNYIYLRGYDNGKSFAKKEYYKPYLFVPSKEEDSESKYRTIHDQVVEKLDFDSIYDAREFSKQYEDVDNFNVYGQTNWAYNYVFDNYRGEIKYDPSTISVCSIDIENRVGEEDIATSIQTTPNEVTAITISRSGKKTVMGCGEFTTDDPNIKYIRCKDEEHLLQVFLEIWNSVEYSPDVVTGWNVNGYDVPYLVGRIVRILGQEAANKLSPWGIICPYDTEIRGKVVTSYELRGIAILDYLELYKKFTYSSQESYRLDHIAFVELGQNKIDYRDAGYTSLNDLHDRNFQLFCEYNVHDVTLVDMLEDEMRLIELVFTIAYLGKVNYVDVLGTVKIWEVIIHNYLMERCRVVPQKKHNSAMEYAGGYVKEVQTGMHRWVTSFDLDSLYPHLIMGYNISPDTFVKRLPSFYSIDQLLDKDYNLDLVDPNSGCSYAANGCMYRKDKQGFLPALMESMYSNRSIYKKEMISVKKEYEKTKDKNLEKEISRLNNLQMAFKILLNSAYGALGNRFFNWFDINHAEAITISGQLSIRWVSDRLNEYLNKICETNNVDRVVANDTDSCYLNLSDLVDAVFEDQSDTKKIVSWLEKVCDQKINPFIDNSYQHLANRMSAYQQKMRMKLECIADKAIWTGKKRYIMNVWYQEGVTYQTGKLKMTGIEAIKSSTPQACRDALKNALSLIMNKDEETLQEYIKTFRSEFSKMKFEYIAFPRGISDISKYKTKDGEFPLGCPIHVKGSLLYNRLVEKYKLHGKYETITNGDKIKFVYLKQPNPYHSNVLASPGEIPSEFDLEKYIDYNKQFEKTYLDPLDIILNTIDWNAEKQNTLDAFFV